MNNPATKVVAPVVNNNGTSLKALHCDVAEKIDAALEALAKVVPHSRDFQTAPDGAYMTARAQHGARVNALQSVRLDMLEIWQSLDRQ